MSFANQLKRLKEAAMRNIPGCPPGKVTVDVRDLRELLHHFDRIDAELRAIHHKTSQQAVPPALPDWMECEAKVQAGTANALERFIYENEPAGNSAAEFRAGLLAVLSSAQKVGM